VEQKYENKAIKIGVENREQHASQGHLSVLKTRSKVCVCVCVCIVLYRSYSLHINHTRSYYF